MLNLGQFNTILNIIESPKYIEVNRTLVYSATFDLSWMTHFFFFLPVHKNSIIVLHSSLLNKVMSHLSLQLHISLICSHASKLRGPGFKSRPDTVGGPVTIIMLGARPGWKLALS